MTQANTRPSSCVSATHELYLLFSLPVYEIFRYGGANPMETSDHMGAISIYSNIECGLGIIGCSLPSLRKLFRFYHGSSRDMHYQYPSNVSKPGNSLCRHALEELSTDSQAWAPQRSGNALGSSGPPAFKLDSRRGTSHGSDDDLIVDADDSSQRGWIVRKTARSPRQYVISCFMILVFL